MIFVASKVSDGNMSFTFGDNKEILENRTKFFKKLGINLKDIVEVKQIHGSKVLCVNSRLNPQIQADGLITKNRNLYLMMKIADCIAIGLYDPKHHIIGLIHAGHKGLLKNIIKKTIGLLQKKFLTDPKDLLVKFSPSIGPCCYQQDIWKKAEKQLTNCNILKKNIKNQKICTYESKEYFSHKKALDTNTKEGRFAVVLGLKNVN